MKWKFYVIENTSSMYLVPNDFFFHNSFLNFLKLHEKLINMNFLNTFIFIQLFSQFIQISIMNSSTS